MKNQKITRRFLREFFVRQMDRILDLEILTKNGKSYWNLTATNFNPFKANNLLLTKIDLSEVWNSISFPLKLVLETYYNFYKRNIDLKEAFRRANKEPEIYWICLDYGCYLFFCNYQHKFNYMMEVQGEDNLERVFEIE